MGLRSFHLFFIGVSIILGAFVAAWAIGEYRTANDPAYIVAAVASLGAAAGLTTYMNAFQKKTKKL